MQVVDYPIRRQLAGLRYPGHTSEAAINVNVNYRSPRRRRNARQGRRSAALELAAVLFVVALALSVNACTKGNLGKSQQLPQQVLLEAASSPGSSPWMSSTTSAQTTEVNRVESPSTTSAQAQDGTVLLSGDQIGLYGGSMNLAVCDRDKMVNFLEQNPGQAQAWRTVTGASDIRSYASTLSPVVLTHDTRVTNHGYENGLPVGFQSVLQTGTAVMVDDTGVPRVRCECGNPLSEPQSNVLQQFSGTAWQGLDTKSFVTIQKSAHPIHQLNLVPVLPAQGAPPPPTPVLALPVGKTKPIPDPNVALPAGSRLVPVAVTPPVVVNSSVTTSSSATTTASTTRNSSSISTSTSASKGVTSGKPSTTSGKPSTTSGQAATSPGLPATTTKPTTAPTR